MNHSVLVLLLQLEGLTQAKPVYKASLVFFWVLSWKDREQLNSNEY